MNKRIVFSTTNGVDTLHTEDRLVLVLDVKTAFHHAELIVATYKNDPEKLKSPRFHISCELEGKIIKEMPADKPIPKGIILK